MSVREALEQVLAIRGVSAAAIVRADGEIIDLLSHDGAGLLSETLKSALSSSRLLAGATPDSEMLQAVIDLSSGPVFLVSLTPEGAEGFISAMSLDSMSSLGRVRLRLKKLLPDLAKAVRA